LVTVTLKVTVSPGRALAGEAVMFTPIPLPLLSGGMADDVAANPRTTADASASIARVDQRALRLRIIVFPRVSAHRLLTSPTVHSYGQCLFYAQKDTGGPLGTAHA
jgi:hypothetical protein